MSRKSENEKHFIEKSAELVAAIDGYNGLDPLDPWYKYMTWLQETYEIDYSPDSLFMSILCQCIATFEADERYKQDRRMIKLFILYISYQEGPEEYFEMMHTAGVGTRVSEFYVSWAHWYNITGDFDRAERIYELGRLAGARSGSLLNQARIAFNANRIKRNDRKDNPNFERKVRSILRSKYYEFIALNWTNELAKHDASKMLVNMREFDHPNTYAIPKHAMPATPRQSTTSLIQKIVNSCSARKNPTESRRATHQLKTNRLNFDIVEDPPRSLAEADPKNMYALGIQLPKNFVAFNKPQKGCTVPPVAPTPCDSKEHTLPMYDKIMLQPAIDQYYSPEELMAYRWYKRRHMVNAFTTKMDAVWSVGHHVPFRCGEWFVKQNLPQRDEVQQDNLYFGDEISDGIWRFSFNIEEHNPKGSGEEFSREELMRIKRIRSSKFNDTKKPSVMQMINRYKMRAPSMVPSPMPSTSKEGADKKTDDSMNISESSWSVPAKKMARSEALDSDLPDEKKNRNTSLEFNELNDTCTTQIFSMCLKGKPASTPMPKMERQPFSTSPSVSFFECETAVPPPEPVQCVQPAKPKEKFEIFVDESMAHLPGAHAAAVKSKVDDNAKFQTFVDETISDSRSHDKIDVEVKSKAVGFEIYRDETGAVIELPEHNAARDPKYTAHATVQPQNDENRPIDGVPVAPQNKPIEPMARRSDSPLKSFNLSLPLSHSERDIIGKTLHKVDYSFDMTDFNQLKTVPKPLPVHDRDNDQQKDGENDEHNDETDLLGQSIYVPREEVIFSDAKHADWVEVTLHMAEGVQAKNEYIAEPVDLDQTQQIIDTQLLNLLNLSPFNSKLQKALLDSVSFVERLTKMDRNVCDMVKIVEPMKPRKNLKLCDRTFSIQKMIGSGSFGNVFKGECSRTKSVFAFKQERPPNIWEYYICLEVHKRLGNPRMRTGCMCIEHALIGNNATIFASAFSPYGTLLNVCNKVKTSTGRNMDEYVVMVFAKQMLAVIDSLHRASIIHGDIKPDNFLVMSPLSHDYNTADLSVQLIDFGQSIDMKLFPKNQVFYSKVKTAHFVCTEMMDNRPWTYQLDLFCLASTIYTMVFGEYMVVRKANKSSNRYITRSVPRYYNRKLWTHLFDVLINIPDGQRMPDLNALEKLLDDEIDALGAKAIRQKIDEFKKAIMQ